MRTAFGSALRFLCTLRLRRKGDAVISRRAGSSARRSAAVRCLLFSHKRFLFCRRKLPCRMASCLRKARPNIHSIAQIPSFKNCLNTLFAKFCAGNFFCYPIKILDSHTAGGCDPPAVQFIPVPVFFYRLQTLPHPSFSRNCRRAADRGSRQAAFRHFRCQPQARAREQVPEREPLPPRALLP